MINSERRCNIVTVEDPIEFVHPDKQAFINQREIGTRHRLVHRRAKYVVRQSPDIILIGEMSDVETMNVALAAAETGHLVFSTVHTCSAAETLDRIMNMFPPHDKPHGVYETRSVAQGCGFAEAHSPDRPRRQDCVRRE